MQQTISIFRDTQMGEVGAEFPLHDPGSILRQLDLWRDDTLGALYHAVNGLLSQPPCLFEQVRGLPDFLRLPYELQYWDRVRGTRMRWYIHTYAFQGELRRLVDLHRRLPLLVSALARGERVRVHVAHVDPPAVAERQIGTSTGRLLFLMAHTNFYYPAAIGLGRDVSPVRGRAAYEALAQRVVPIPDADARGALNAMNDLAANAHRIPRDEFLNQALAGFNYQIALARNVPQEDIIEIIDDDERRRGYFVHQQQLDLDVDVVYSSSDEEGE